MRHAKRDFLKTDDIKHSMEKLSIPVITTYLLKWHILLERLRVPLIHTLHLRERPQHTQSLVY